MVSVPLRTPEEVVAFFDMKAGALGHLAEGRPVAARRDADFEPVLDETGGAAVDAVYWGQTYTVAFDRPAAKMLGE